MHTTKCIAILLLLLPAMPLKASDHCYPHRLITDSVPRITTLKLAYSAGVPAAVMAHLKEGLALLDNRPFLRLQDNKIVLDVEVSPVAAMGNAYDAIMQTPGIMDSTSLQFHGQPVTLLVDGEHSNLSGHALKAYLVALPGTRIRRIEVLAVPALQYNSSAPAINIILVKDNKPDAEAMPGVARGTGL